MEFNLLSLGGVNFTGLKLESSGSKSERRTSSELRLPLRELTGAPTVLACLSWHTRSSTFAGRDTEVLALKKWCDHPTPISFKFLHGDGGIGKSRLAAEFALALRKLAWSAGFVDSHVDWAALQGADQPTLIVMDYPEDNPDALRTLLETLGKLPTSSKVRVLCLSRYFPSAWSRLTQTSGVADFYDQDAIHLRGIELGAAYDLYNTAIERISIAINTIPKPAEFGLFSHWFSLTDFHSNPLYILAAAAHASFVPDDIFLQFDGRQAVAALIGREHDRMRRLAVSAGLPKQAYIDVAAIATLQDGIPEAMLSSAAHLLPSIEKIRHDDEVLGAISRRGDDGILYFDMPDVVAGCFVAEALKDAENSAEMLWVAMTSRPAPLARLSRLAADAQGIRHESNSPLITAAIRNLEFPDRFRSFLYELALHDRETLDPILLPLQEALWRRQAELAKDPFLKSCALNNVANVLGDMERHAEAIDILLDAIKLNRRSKGDRLLIQGELASKLLNLGRAYVDQGNPWKGAKFLREAIDIQENVIRKKGFPTSGLELWSDARTLWLAYDNLGRSLAEQKNFPAARAAIVEALRVVDAARKFVNPAKTWAEHSLKTHLATAKAGMGDIVDGLRILQEQEVELRQMASRGGSPDLAFVLNLVNQGIFVTDGIHEARISKEAVNLREHLAKANESILLVDKLASISRGRMSDLACRSRSSRSSILQTMNCYDEYEESLGDEFHFLSARSDTADGERLVKMVTAAAISLLSRFDETHAQRRLLELFGNSAEASLGWRRGLTKLQC